VLKILNQREMERERERERENKNFIKDLKAFNKGKFKIELHRF